MPMTPYVEDQQDIDERQAEIDRLTSASQERTDKLRRDIEQYGEEEGYRRNGYSRDPENMPGSPNYNPGARQWVQPGEESHVDTSDEYHIINNPNQMRRNAYDEMSRLYDQAPSADDLDVFYEGVGSEDELGSLFGGPSEVSRQGQGEAAQQRVMDALRSLSDQGGYTSADRSMQAAMAAQNAQQVGAQNQAQMRNAYGRGMGGGGGQLASALSGSQGLASANANSNAQLQQAAMQRLMDSYGMQGSLAGQQNSQQLQRQNALDAYNQRQLDWRRQRGAANTAMRNQSRESSSAARQQAWENKRSALAERTNQFIGGTGTGAPQRNDVGAAVARGVGAGVSTLASFFGGGGGR